MIKKILLLSTCILLMSCGSKSKLVQEEKLEIKEQVDSTGTKSETNISVKDSLNESNEWSWEPADPNCSEPAEIVTPDGTKIKIPKKGVLRHNKKSSHSKTFNKKESSAAVKKTTDTKKLTHKRDKQVERTPFAISWWIWLLIAAGCLAWYQWKRR